MRFVKPISESYGRIILKNGEVRSIAGAGNNHTETGIKPECMAEKI